MSISQSLIAQAAAVMRALSAMMPLWLVSPAQAADVYVTFIWGRPVIHVEGVILPGDEKKFAQFSYQYATVRPSGPGGEITTAIAIGKMIWERGYTTLLLRDDGQCNSAFTTIWLSGRKAAVQINSALGFHSSFVAQTGEASEEGNQLIMAHLETVGLTHKQARALTYAAPPHDVRWAMLWWARELGFSWQYYPLLFGTASCSARWCVGTP